MKYTIFWNAVQLPWLHFQNIYLSKKSLLFLNLQYFVYNDYIMDNWNCCNFFSIIFQIALNDHSLIFWLLLLPWQPVSLAIILVLHLYVQKCTKLWNMNKITMHDHWGQTITYKQLWISNKRTLFVWCNTNETNYLLVTATFAFILNLNGINIVNRKFKDKYT